MDLKFLIFIQLIVIQYCASHFNYLKAEKIVYNKAPSLVVIESLLRHGRSNDPFPYEENNGVMSINLVRCLLTKDGVCLFVKSDTEKNDQHESYKDKKFERKSSNKKIHENFRAAKRVLNLNNDNKVEKEENNYIGACKHCSNKEKPSKEWEHHESESDEHKDHSFKKRRTRRETRQVYDEESNDEMIFNKNSIINRLDISTSEGNDDNKYIEKANASSLLRTDESKLNNLPLLNRTNESKGLIDETTNGFSMCKNCFLVNSSFQNLNETQDLILSEILYLLNKNK